MRLLAQLTRRYVFFSENVRALVLNSSYQPVKLVSWQKAFILFFQGKVEVLEYHDHAARSARAAHKLPSVIRLKTYIAPRRANRLKFSRENVYLRDNFTCQYCGVTFAPKDLTLDHVVPASKQGRKDWTNVVAACRTCNHRKGNRTPLGANMPLLTEPRVPAWLPSLKPAFRLGEVPDSWAPYLELAGA
jgi:5-methylcytosine-specific restriction endonuclease McrA